MWVLKALMYIGMFVVSVVQVFATVDGVQHFTGWSSFGAWIVALFMGWMPIVGTITGIYGAVKVWGWPWYWACALFLWQIVLVAILMGVAAVVDKAKAKRV